MAPCFQPESTDFPAYPWLSWPQAELSIREDQWLELPWLLQNSARLQAGWAALEPGQAPAAGAVMGTGLPKISGYLPFTARPRNHV